MLFSGARRRASERTPGEEIADESAAHADG
jgi:hypothetical protein